MFFMKPKIFCFRHEVWIQPGLHLVQCFSNKPNDFKHIKAISTKTTTGTLLVWSSVAYKVQSNVSGHHVQCYADQMNLSRYCCISRSYKYTGVTDGHCEVWLKPTCSKELFLSLSLVLFSNIETVLHTGIQLRPSECIATCIK